MLGIRRINVIDSIDLYRIFHLVARHKNISKAAKELFMTQSAVSQSIQKLEQELKTHLFHRTAKGVTLTSDGETLLHYVVSALNTLEVAEEKLLASQHLVSGQLRIGVGDTISRYFLLPYVEKFFAAYPGVNLKILNGTTNEICQYIKDGQADIGICNLPLADTKFKVLPVMEIEDVFVCGQKFKETIQEPVALEDILNYPLILLERNANSRQYIDAFFKSKNLVVSPEIELGSHDLILEFAKINIGIACVTKQFSLNYLEQKLVSEIKVTEAIPKRHVGLIYSKYAPLTHASRTFIEQFNLQL